MTEARPTRRDQSRGPGPTRRDNVASSGATRRDGPDQRSDAGRAAHADYADHGGLPAPVFAVYEPVEALPSGGEAHRVMKVRHRWDGTFHVVKVYGLAVRPDPDLLAALQEADRAHLVRIDGWGEETDRYKHSACWEILEFVPAGSLRDLIRTEGPALPPDLVRRVLVELTAALDHLHTAVKYHDSTGLAHRDVKPENILVRDRSTLDLVLCDFGLVAEVRATRMSSRRAGTAEYQAPETWQTRSRDPAQDWWSLGVLIAELLIGRNPNAGVMGGAMDDSALFTHLTQYGVDLTEVTDPRWRLLCSGLLTFAAANRWGATEIREWLDNGSPEVHSARGEQQPTQRVVQPIEVAGRVCRDPAEVALVFSENWQAATRQFTDRELRLELSYWLDDNFPGVALPKDLFRTDPSTRDVASLRVARFISWIAPEMPPSYQGRAMNAPGIAVLADRGLAGDAVAAEFTRRLDSAWLGTFARHTCRIHQACAAGEGCAVLRSSADRIEQAREAVPERAAVVPAGPLRTDELDTAQARLVQVLADPDSRALFRRRDAAAAVVGWWAELAADGMADDDRGLAALALAVATRERAYLAAGDVAAERLRQRHALRDQRRESARARLARIAPLGRDLVALAMTLVLAYLATLVGLLLVARLGREWVSGPAAIAAAFADIQTRIAVPVALLLACVVVRPRWPLAAGRSAALAALSAGGVVAVALGADRLDLLGFPVLWTTGVRDGLSAANELLVGEANTLAPTVILAGIAGLILANRIVAVRRTGPGSAGRRVRIGKTVVVVVVATILVVRAAVLLWQWRIPSALPDPLALWLNI